jgi:RNA recognition motif-containing protein
MIYMCNTFNTIQVPEAVTEADVLALFGKFGTVKRVELNGPRGFAFVDYDSAVSVQACLASTKEGPLELLGAALKVSIIISTFLADQLFFVTHML